MGVAAGHSADDEAIVVRQMSLRPANAELRSVTGPMLAGDATERSRQRAGTTGV